MVDMLQQATSSFMPHGMCYLWEPGLLWTHVVADVLIGGAYYAIPPALLVLVVRARREVPRGAEYATRGLPHEWMFLAFGLFIVACGTTHFLAAWNVWHASYWLSGGVKVVTAVASVATAVALPPLIPRALGVLRDARESERRRVRLEEANEELAQLNERLRQMDELKTQLFANVSHELRTPISLILGPVSQRLESEDLDPELAEDLSLVRRNARLLQRRVDDLLELARLDAGVVNLERGPADAAGVVRATAERYIGVAHSRGIELDMDLPDSVPAELDADKVERVVENLVTNAFKWVPDGGIVRISLRADDGDEPTVRIVVEDSGPGIPEAERTAVFERFRQVDGGTRRRVGGTGLGLAIVADFVRLHGGDVVVDRSDLGGARFTVALPWHRPTGPVPEHRADTDESPGEAKIHRPAAESAHGPASRGPSPEAPSPEPPAAAAPAPESAGRPRVLVVEDSEEMRAFVCRVLRDAYDCDTAPDGPSALTYLEESTPDAIITDVMMPGMDGPELLERMRERPSLERVPVLVLTAIAEQDIRTRMLRAGAQDFVTKPFEPAELEARISNLVTMKRVRDLLESELESVGEDLGTMTEELARRRWELQEALEEVRAAHKEAESASRAKTEFLAVMSHELRTPLNAIVGYADLLQAGVFGEVRPEQDDQLVRIRRSAGHLVRLIEDILDFARTESVTDAPASETIRVDELMRDVVSAVETDAHREGLDLHVDVEPGLAFSSDPERLRRILTNLVTNAVRFTDEGAVRIRARRDQGFVVLEVQDTGVGIRAVDIERIFDPFWQVDQSSTREVGGSGLGLSIARRLTRSLGGELRVESEPGIGSTFTIRLRG